MSTPLAGMLARVARENPLEARVAAAVSHRVALSVAAQRAVAQLGRRQSKLGRAKALIARHEVQA